MKKKGFGGGNTITGLKFERGKNILSILSNTKGYSVKGNVIYYLGKEVARSYRKNGLYKFLESQGVDYKKIISKKLLPDEALYVIVKNTLFVIEIKYQEVAGSVDEKLQTCDFKKKQYKKLMAPLNIEVEYIYILSDWFRKPEYKDVLDYIISVGCQYYFEYLPLEKLGLPVPQ
jgi:hypothetical protein